jgi:hypothetical protein
VLNTVAGNVMPVATAALIGGPIAAGVGAGYLASNLKEKHTDVDEAKNDEMLAEYERLTDAARRQTFMKSLPG